ncbi:MAG: SMP-30/gluconolactonase/LRE family protein [Betaproteobacteria bacterium]|nr:SMP-30/gluconolactonase/LRE family protein [Betaproteobacteria bacterium]
MTLEIREKGMLDVAGAEAAAERLATGFGFGEGPVWDRAGKRVIFSDMKHDHMRSWRTGEGIRTFRQPSGKANGNTYDRQGRLVSCEHATSRVVRQEKDGAMTVLATHYGGRELNSPNDIVVKSDGAIYFSDPTYGRIREDVGVPRELQLAFRGVYRVAGDGAPTQLLADDFEQPNGLCFALDEKRLFVNDTMRGHIRVFGVKSDGTLTGGEVWAALTGEGEGRPDGMKLDSAGNLYCTGPGGVHVLDPRARCLGVIRTPERVTNIAWGDDDLRSLYLTGITSLYRVRVKVPGRLTY